MSANAGSLGDLQRAFQDYLLGSSDSFQAAVRDSRKADRTTLLDVYRDGYALRLIEALTTDYPGLRAMAGPADFDLVARAYIAAHPSRHPSVRWFGRGMADFIATTPPYSGSPAAAEMARFEWALGESFDSPDVTPIAADALIALPPEAWETLAFTVLPSLRRHTFVYEVAQAWQRRDEVEAGDLDEAHAPAARGRLDLHGLHKPGVLSEFLVGDPALVHGSVQGDELVELALDLGRHGAAVLAVREGLEFDPPPQSDCQPLQRPVLALLDAGIDVHCLRDCTRGGLTAALSEIARDGGWR